MKLHYKGIQPCAKPRMTRQDKWKKRPVVIRYRDYADLLRSRLPENYDSKFFRRLKVKFIFKVKDSFSKKLKKYLINKPHDKTPDLDNLIKGVLDIFVEKDQVIYDIQAQKYWGEEDEIFIEFFKGVTT